MKGIFIVCKFDENWLSSTSYRDTSSEVENNNLVLPVTNRLLSWPLSSSSEKDSMVNISKCQKLKLVLISSCTCLQIMD